MTRSTEADETTTAILDVEADGKRVSAVSRCKREQEVLMLALESAPSGLVILNSAGHIQAANRAVENLFGYSRPELVGRRVETLIPQRFRQQHVKQREMFSAGETHRPGGRDLVGLRKDGTEIPLQVHLNRVETDFGEVILCTIIDISERIRHQEQLELARRAAESANRAKSDFLARMSHEIRTPMNLIMGMNALLLESSLDARQRERIEISDRNVRRLLRLINGILDLSKVEAGMLTLQAVPFDLRELLEECAATISSAIEQKGLQFRISIDTDVTSYWSGDPERLQQVLLNLIGNSVKFTSRGQIQVTVHAASGDGGQPGLRFEVSDTGCGVPPEKSAMIFEPFQQADGSIDRAHEGTGLGLSISRALVEMMSGSIWLEPKPCPGTKIVFTIFLPLATEAAIRDKRSAARCTKIVRDFEPGGRILIVEDNPENVILLRAFLEDLPFSLDLAANGAEAIEKRLQNTYDLVLMDIQMPVMDGYTATREIRAWEKVRGLPPVPIVALTAHALTGAAQESFDAGCDGHVTKPVERNDLVEAIAKFSKRPPPAKPSIPESIVARRPAFLANRLRDLVTLNNALSTGDFQTIQTIGHNCKGTGAGYGFPVISEIGSAIEQHAKELATEELTTAVEQFERYVRGECRTPLAG